MGIRSTHYVVCVITSIKHLIEMGHEHVCPLLKRMEGRKDMLLYRRNADYLQTIYSSDPHSLYLEHLHSLYPDQGKSNL
jgi:hypothetical protein